GVVDLALAPHVRGVVEVAFGIDLVEADRGGHEFLLDGLDRCDRLDAAAGAETITMHGFGGGDRKLVRGGAEHALDGAGLVDVVHGGRCAVRVDIVDIARGHGSIVKRHLHGHGRTVDRRVDHVGGVSRHAVAYQLGEDGSAAGFGALVFL